MYEQRQLTLNMRHGERILHGLIGGIAAIALVIILLVVFRCFDYSPIYILNSDKLAAMSAFMQNDSVTMTKLETIKELEIKGILLTPQEYTSNISSYYNALISFLIALFIIFSFIGYFSIRLASKKDIQDKLDDMLDDSIKFRTATVNSVLEVIGDTFATKEEQRNAIEELHEEMREETEASLDELREQISDCGSSDQTIVTS